LRDRLAKARLAFSGAFAGVLGRSGITEESFEDLEEALLRADVGIGVTTALLDDLRERVAAKEITEPQALIDALEADMVSRLEGSDRTLAFDPTAEGPNVWMFVGVNGVGKTTTIGKLAYQFKKAGKSVLLGASDTFRAAAVDQLKIWSERVGVPMASKGMGADPAAVAFETMQQAVDQNIDIVIVDTAGRLHNKVNLMNELSKIKRVMQKVIPNAPHDVLLILDASTGQNAIEQAKQFTNATEVTALALTKLDGTAKGGVAIGISDQFKIPVKYIGIGEKMEDLQVFNRKEFVDSIFHA
jgi:fused signal recognition particle receptor